jgi:hypothetical protein
MKDTKTKAAEPATKTATGGDLSLYRVVKVPEDRKCLRVKINGNGWRFYRGHELRLTGDQAAKINESCPGSLELIPEL